MNYFRTGLLLAALTALFMAIGYLIGGGSGMLIAFIVAAGLNLFSYWNSDKIVLRMNHARAVDAQSAPEFHRLVAQLAARAGLPMPRLYLIDTAQPNAFATGRDPQHAAIAATTGLLRMLDEHELAGVLAHELSHIRHRDTLIMTLTATIAGAISMLAHYGFLFGGLGGNNRNNNPFGIAGLLLAMIVAPLAALLVQMAISRTREYAADRSGAEICGEPMWLASALRKIAGAARQQPNPYAQANPAMAPLYIVNPLAGLRFDNLFSTHPAVEDRIAALAELAREEGKAEPLQGAPGGGAVASASSVPGAFTGRAGPWGAHPDRPDRRHGPWG